MNSSRWQFRLSTAIWLTTIVCLFCAWWADRSQLAKEMSALREENTKILWSAPLPDNAAIQIVNSIAADVAEWHSAS